MLIPQIINDTLHEIYCLTLVIVLYRYGSNKKSLQRSYGNTSLIIYVIEDKCKYLNLCKYCQEFVLEILFDILRNSLSILLNDNSSSLCEV